MSQVPAFIQDPQAKLDYSVDWSHWLLPGDTISASTWTSSSINMTLSAGSFTTTTTTIWVEFTVDAAEGDQYEAVNHITTVGGRIQDQTLFMKVETK